MATNVKTTKYRTTRAHGIVLREEHFNTISGRRKYVVECSCGKRYTGQTADRPGYTLEQHIKKESN